MYSSQDTICAPATASGGAIAVVRVSGSETQNIIRSLVKFNSRAGLKANSVRYGNIPEVDEVLVSIFLAPHSYTGEDAAEISCHASPYIVSKIVELICAAGARLAEPGEFTRRAFLNGKMDLAQAEAVADIISSSSAASHKLALKQLKGGYSAELRALRDSMLEIAALMELELDFSEEDVEFADRGKLRSLLDSALSKVETLADSFRTGNAIRRGIPVAIVGAPNSGKSTLLNALVGEQRALVSPIAGTTRDTIEELMTLSGVLYRFIDTAGLHQSDDEVEKMGIERSLSKLGEAEIVIALLDGTVDISESVEVLHMVSECLENDPFVIFVRNKLDIEGDCFNMPAKEYAALLGISGPVLDISARDGIGLDALREAIVEGQKSLFGISENNGTLVTSLRHCQALKEAAFDLHEVIEGLELGTPTDLVAQSLRGAIRSLGSILGEISSDEVLGTVFERFCVGK